MVTVENSSDLLLGHTLYIFLEYSTYLHPFLENNNKISVHATNNATAGFHNNSLIISLSGAIKNLSDLACIHSVTPVHLA